MQYFSGEYEGVEGGCAPYALRQLTDAPDQEVMAVCLLHGFNPKAGGMTNHQVFHAARQLGIKLGGMHAPKKPMSLAELTFMSRSFSHALLVGMENHVLVLRHGEVMDVGDTQPFELVQLIVPVEKEARK